MSEHRNFSSSGVQTRRDWFNRAFVKSGVLSGQLFVKLAYVKLYRAARAFALVCFQVSLDGCECIKNNHVEFNRRLYTVTHSAFRNNHICFSC